MVNKTYTEENNNERKWMRKSSVSPFYNSNKYKRHTEISMMKSILWKFEKHLGQEMIELNRREQVLKLENPIRYRLSQIDSL